MVLCASERERVVSVSAATRRTRCAGAAVAAHTTFRRADAVPAATPPRACASVSSYGSLRMRVHVIVVNSKAFATRCAGAQV
ncbi:unnamed protein product [Closterium sp. Yama58-4]|nr:unnamed protein product [Closterium sp. Yama58-4]